MRALAFACIAGVAVLAGCSKAAQPNVAAAALPASSTAAMQSTSPSTESSLAPAGDLRQHLGFDRNEYPGDAAMAGMKSKFEFTGYWLTNPPGASSNGWAGKRAVLRQQGWGFLVLVNGKLEAQIKKAASAGTAPADLGREDAAVAIAAAKQEGFPAHTILFLDQEEGGRLTDVQAVYLLAWTEAVAASQFRPGVYASGQLVPDGPGAQIDTVRDIRARVKQGHLHEIAVFDYQDACPPAPGCTLQAKPLNAAGEPDLAAWQYAQSPRRPDITKSCANTYAADGNCYAPGFGQTFLDMDIAKSADPSAGR